MIKFNKPENLNGVELLDELKNAGVAITKPPFIDDNGDFWLNINPSDESTAAVVVATHTGNIVAPESTVVDKLAAAGLTIEELKQALGL